MQSEKNAAAIALAGPKFGAPKVTASPRAGYTLSMLVLIYAMSFVDRNILYVVAPSVQAELQLNDTELGLLSGLAFALFYSTIALPIARIAERRSRVALITGALVLWSVMTAASGAATRFWHLFAARLGVGVGEGACSPSAQSMICDLYPPHRRATALSTYSVGVPLGVMLGGVGGAMAAEMFGWRGAFVAAAIPGLLLALVFRLMRWMAPVSNDGESYRGLLSKQPVQRTIHYGDYHDRP